MNSPNIGIILNQPIGTYGEHWISNLLIEGNIITGGIYAYVGRAAVNLRHVVMYNSATTQPRYGIEVQCADELVICDGTDITNCGNCLQIDPGNGMGVLAAYVSDSFFDSGNGAGCVYVAPSGTGFVWTMRFSNVWTSTGTNTPGTNGFTFNGAGSSNPPAIQDVSLVNCLGQNFADYSGLYANAVSNLSVTSSTFGGNYDGINIGAGMSNFILNGNKCGNYAGIPGVAGNSNYGIVISPGASGNFIVVENLIGGNGVGGFYNGGTGPNQAVANNVL
jgi:hypothetical protein